MSGNVAINYYPRRLGAPSNQEFNKLSVHLKRICGIHLPLNEKNLALMSSRLNKLRSSGINSYQELIQALDQNDKRFINLFVSAMTTNTTHFFREPQHFEFFTKVISEQLSKSNDQNEIKVWCAASSTGEEAYGLAMSLNELQSKYKFSFRILATDIDHVALARAKNAVYTKRQIEGIPLNYLQKYFVKEVGAEEPYYRVQDDLKATVQFGRFNLLRNYPFQGKFDVIFCRNVLIYFDKESVNYVIQQMAQVLKPGGYLFLGHSEAIAGMVSNLMRAGPAIYKRV